MNDPKRILVVFLGLIVLIVCAFGGKGHMEDEGYKKQVLYTTAIHAEDANRFNYAVDSQQGNLLVHGTFSTKTENLVKFPEMTKAYTYVNRVKEHYTMHTYETCGKNSCTTHTYYSWDMVGGDTISAKKINLYGREYAGTKFNFFAFLADQSCAGITQANADHGFFASKHGCEGDDYYIDNDNRYVYQTVPQTFSATFLASSLDGGLKPVGENSITLQNKSIDQQLHDVGAYKVVIFWVVLVAIILLTFGAGYVAYQWVMEDGRWSLED